MISNFASWALVLGLGMVPSAAQTSGHPAGWAGQSQRMDRMAEQLKLSEAQATQIQVIHARHAEAIKAQAQAVAEARTAFRVAAQNPDTSPAQLKTLYQAKADKAFALMLEHRTTQTEIRALLTPEQRIELDKRQAYRQGLKQGRCGKGGRGKGV